MSKVDEAYDAIHHGIAQGDQGIDTSYLNAVDELLQELTHIFSSDRGRSGEYLVLAAPKCVLGYGLTVVRYFC